MYGHYMTNQIMIIGDGIAGPVAAMALERIGLQSVLFEAHERGSEGVGAFLTLAVNGLEALDLLGLRDTVCDLGMDTPRMKLISGRGKELGAFPMPAHTVGRGELYA